MSTHTLWATAMQAFLDARAAEVSYDDAVFMPAFHADQNGGPQIPDGIVAAADALTQERCRTEEELILTPTDVLSNIRWKLTYARMRWCDDGCGGDVPDDWWNAISSDMDRVSGNPNPDARLTISQVSGRYEVPASEPQAVVAAPASEMPSGEALLQEAQINWVWQGVPAGVAPQEAIGPTNPRAILFMFMRQLSAAVDENSDTEALPWPCDHLMRKLRELDEEARSAAWELFGNGIKPESVLPLPLEWAA